MEKVDNSISQSQTELLPRTGVNFFKGFLCPKQDGKKGKNVGNEIVKETNGAKNPILYKKYFFWYNFLFKKELEEKIKKLKEWDQLPRFFNPGGFKVERPEK